MTNSTLFVDQTTVIQAAWCNDVNAAVYTNQFNVKSYGAIGDGTADDTTAIQAAINAAAGGGVVYLPQGTYKVTSALTMSSNGVTVRGAGPKASYLKTTSATANVLYITGNYTSVQDLGFTTSTVRTAGDYLKISGTYCYVNNFYMSAPYTGIEVTGIFTWVNTGLIENVTSRATAANSSAVIIDVAGEADLYIDNLVVRNDNDTASKANWPEHVIWYKRGIVVHVANSELLQANIGMLVCPSAGTDSTMAFSARFTNVYFDTHITHCVAITPTSTGMVNDFIFSSCQFGILPNGNTLSITQSGSTTVVKIKVTHCVLTCYNGGSGTGIYSTGTVSDVNVSNSTVGYDGHGFGTSISFNNGARYVITGNEVLASATNAIVIAGTADGFIVTNNFCDGTGGIAITASGANKVVANNLEL